ncbi:hypothetical protein B0T17DRAFT_505305 [Bombardia bombarda]|uniref:Uncharacterized protein n=1 Tax=Bombardia bombarda TaxID=252184 RepID=A0AA40C897_9PEZI|nr:hypothetical protein B0T17DRAFT_505305 [Bombardia bombarda]
MLLWSLELMEAGSTNWRVVGASGLVLASRTDRWMLATIESSRLLRPHLCHFDGTILAFRSIGESGHGRNERWLLTVKLGRKFDCAVIKVKHDPPSLGAVRGLIGSQAMLCVPELAELAERETSVRLAELHSLNRDVAVGVDERARLPVRRLGKARAVDGVWSFIRGLRVQALSSLAELTGSKWRQIGARPGMVFWIEQSSRAGRTAVANRIRHRPLWGDDKRGDWPLARNLDVGRNRLGVVTALRTCSSALAVAEQCLGFRLYTFGHPSIQEQATNLNSLKRSSAAAFKQQARGQRTWQSDASLTAAVPPQQ